jgi:hypothetical protein
MGEIIGIVIGSLVGVIIIFLICRELVCWYWKINRLVELMEQQNSLLSSLMSKNISSSNASNNNSSAGGNFSEINTSNAPPINRNDGDTWVCKKCGEENRSTSSSCKGCGEYR